MAQRNMWKIIEEARGCVNPYYDMTMYEVKELLCLTDPADAIFKAFEFGYAQGMKAAASKAKKASALNS